MQEGTLFVVSGPSGSGKTTLTRRVVRMVNNLRFSVSCTTREQRPGEVDGADYRFISRGRFEEMVQNKMFAEWALVHGHLYGTPIEELKMAQPSGSDLLLDIDTQGARSIKNKCDSGVYIFITPSSLDLLKERLINRKGEGMIEIAGRLENAEKQMEEIHSYDYIIINDSLEESVENLAAVIRAERCKKERVLKSLRKSF